MIEVNSYPDFVSRLNGNEKTYLLLYKKGSEKSDCAFLNVLSGSANVKNAYIFHADVNIENDIHDKYNITFVPALLEFRNRVFINTFKDCNDATQYKAFFEGTLSQSGKKDVEKPVKLITVLSAPTCSWCITLKTYLKLHNIVFTDIDVSRDQKAPDALFKRSGQMWIALM